VTTVETTAKPIEVFLSRPHLEVTCRGRPSSPHAAETALRAWALANAQRDHVIRAAAAAGVSVHRIHEITGIARTTVLRILGSPPRPAPRRPS
jgi:hypothetical protein